MTITTLETKFRGDRESLIPDYIRRNGHEVQELNTPGKLEWIDIDNITIPEYQRETDANWVKKSLNFKFNYGGKRSCGFDWNSFGCLTGGRDPETGEVRLTDGLGRLNLAKTAGIKEVPVFVVECSYKESAFGFFFTQKEGKRNLNAEQLFNAKYESGDTSALMLVEIMSDIGVSVRRDSHNVLPAGSTDPTVLVGTLTRAQKETSDTELLSMVVNTIKKMYPNIQTIPSDMFVGLTIFFKTYPALLQPCKAQREVMEILQDFPRLCKNPKKLPFKKSGGNQHNKEYASYAYGIVKSIRDATDTHCVLSTLKKSAIVDIYDLDL